ncbi:MAG: hypothetical protein DMG12_25680, partial [Acidobacteria bacterium]
MTSAAGNPSNLGTVTFFKDGTPLCSAVALTGNTATCSPSLAAGGPYSITATYSGTTLAPGYSGSTSGPLAQTVNKATLTVTASSPTVTYGDPAPTITASYSGFKNGQDATALTTEPVCTTAYTTTSDATTTPSTNCSGGSATNYTFSYVPGSVTVNTATLTVTASSPSVSYGDPVPTVTAGYSGFKNGQNATALTTAPTCTTAYTTASAVASSSATSCSGGVATNYSFSYVPGSVTVNTATLTVTASSPSVAYGDPVPTITPGYSGFKNSQDATALP